MTSLLAFFLSSSKATKFRSNQKKKFEEDFKEGQLSFCVCFNIFGVDEKLNTISVYSDFRRPKKLDASTM